MFSFLNLLWRLLCQLESTAPRKLRNRIVQPLLLSWSEVEVPAWCTYDIVICVWACVSHLFWVMVQAKFSYLKHMLCTLLCLQDLIKRYHVVLSNVHECLLSNIPCFFYQISLVDNLMFLSPSTPCALQSCREFWCEQRLGGWARISRTTSINSSARLQDAKPWRKFETAQAAQTSWRKALKRLWQVGNLMKTSHRS